MGEHEEILDALLSVALKLKEIPFPELVRATTGYKIIPVNRDLKEDKELLEILINAAKNLIDLSEKTKRRFRGDRINEVGRRIEQEFVQALKATAVSVKLLSAPGYPNIELRDSNGRVTYLESKAVSKGWKSSLRAFYYTKGHKIKADARHLLIGWVVEEESPKYWRITGFSLFDLYNLKVKLKAEFNANYRDLLSTIHLHEYSLKH